MRRLGTAHEVSPTLVIIACRPDFSNSETRRLDQPASLVASLGTIATLSPNMQSIATDSSVMPHHQEAPEAVIARMHAHARAAGRNPADISIEGRVFHRGAGPEAWRHEYQTWHALGASHMQVFTMGAGFEGPDTHIAAIAEMKAVLNDD